MIDRLLDLFAARFTPAPLEYVPLPGEEAWQAGDLAECILTDPWRLPSGQIGIGPVYLEVRIVDRVDIVRHSLTGEPAQFLVFTRYGRRGYEAIAFRKVRPRPDSATPAADAFLRQTRLLHSPLESEMS